MVRQSLQQKAAESCGRSRCDENCINRKLGNMEICHICTAAYQHGYKNGYKAAKSSR